MAITARAPRPADVILAADRLPRLSERPGAGTVRCLMIGDLIGKPGREALERTLPDLRAERHIDLVTANGENLAGGMGLTASTAAAVFAAGVDVITSGNHIWDKREIYAELERDERILRPLNYGLAGVPGRGWGVFHAHDGTEVAVINAQGRTYMQPIESPFAMVDTPARTMARTSCPPSGWSTSTARSPARRRPSGCSLTGASAPWWGPTRTCPPPTSGSSVVAPPTSVIWA